MTPAQILVPASIVPLDTTVSMVNAYVLKSYVSSESPLIRTRMAALTRVQLHARKRRNLSAKDLDLVKLVRPHAGMMDGNASINHW